LDEFVKVYNEHHRQEQEIDVVEETPKPETVVSPPVLVKTVEASNVRRMKVFPKITPLQSESPINLVPDSVDGDYAIINGQRYHKKAMPTDYIQNEEQTESSLWSSTVSNNTPTHSITPQEYIDTVKRSSE